MQRVTEWTAILHLDCQLNRFLAQITNTGISLQLSGLVPIQFDLVVFQNAIHTFGVPSRLVTITPYRLNTSFSRSTVVSSGRLDT